MSVVQKNIIDNSYYLQNFSKRELDVIKIILEGNYKYKEIAAKLNISVYTVKFHLNRMYKKPGVSDPCHYFRFLIEIHLNHKKSAKTNLKLTLPNPKPTLKTIVITARKSFY